MLTFAARRSALPVMSAVLAVTMLGAGCSQIEDAAQNQVDNATQRAGEAVESQVADQAQSVLDDALASVDNPCSELIAATEDERSRILTATLQAFWLADLSTQSPPADVSAGFTAAVVSGCDAAPDSAVAQVAQETYGGGGYSPPQG